MLTFQIGNLGNMMAINCFGISLHSVSTPVYQSADMFIIDSRGDEIDAYV